MDIDGKIALLSDLFPDQDSEIILDSFLKASGDFDETVVKLLLNENIIMSPFDHLIRAFPDVEIESIEAFLLTQDETNDLERITTDFMKQSSYSSSSSNNSNYTNFSKKKTSKSHDRPLKMKLSDFGALLKTSNDLDIKPLFRPTKGPFRFTCN